MKAAGQFAKTRNREKGAALVEFALVLVPTLGFVFLFFQIAWLVYAWACVQESVREGVRYGITCPVSSGLNAAIQKVVVQYSFGFVVAGNAKQYFSVHYYSPTDPSTEVAPPIKSGDIIKVTVDALPVYLFPPILHDSTPILITAASADVMSCPTATMP